MPICWMKFSEEASLPASFTPEEQRRFEAIYDPTDPDSVWSRSCDMLALPRSNGPLVSWFMNVPYVNWNALVETVSCGWITVVQQGASWNYLERRNLFTMPKLFKSQWRIERYVDRILNGAPLPYAQEEQILESTALGLSLQAIMQRLPKNSPQEFASWLAEPNKAPLTVRKTMMQIQSIQRRRSQLSNAWLTMFPPRPARDQGMSTPEMFWDRPPEGFVATPLHAKAAPANDAAAEPVTATPADTTVEWQGLSVCGGQVTGRAFPVSSMKDFKAPGMQDLPILVFPRARPETVELFPHAAALLFAEGGALSHACTVAREQGIPCVTGLGENFFQRIQQLEAQHGKVWLVMDGGAAQVKVLQDNRK